MINIEVMTDTRAEEVRRHQSLRGSSGSLAWGGELPAAEGWREAGSRLSCFKAREGQLIPVPPGQPQHLGSGTPPSRGPYDKAWPSRSGETCSHGHEGFFFFLAITSNCGNFGFLMRIFILCRGKAASSPPSLWASP